MSSASVAGWTNTGVYQASDIQLIANTGRAISFGPRLKERVVPHTHNSFDDRNFSAAGFRVWNAKLCRHDTSYKHFKQSLKGHTFTGPDLHVGGPGLTI